MWRRSGWIDGNWRFWSGTLRGSFNLPLQFQQIAPQAITYLKAQLSEFEELLANFMLAPENVDCDERRSDGEQPEHYEYELHYWHSPVCT